MNVECHGDQDTTWDHKKRIKTQQDTSKRKREKKTKKMPPKRMAEQSISGAKRLPESKKWYGIVN